MKSEEHLWTDTLEQSELHDYLGESALSSQIWHPPIFNIISVWYIAISGKKEVSKELSF